jgi:HTH-type transcriptional regulator / antitoxin MqsA
LENFMTYSHICPFCEEGTTHESIYSGHVKLGRRLVLVEGLKKVVCDFCMSESVPEELHDANLKTIQEFAEFCRGAVTEGMLRGLRENWNLTQKEASLLFGAGKSSFAKWEARQSKLSTPSSLLIQTALHVPEVVPYLAELANFRLSKSLDCKNSKIERGHITGGYETVRFSTEDASNNVLILQAASQARHFHTVELPAKADWESALSKQQMSDSRVLLEVA